ncbi:MAG: zinc-binding dehydrogenase, partial [Actinomycetota bacterium]
ERYGDGGPETFDVMLDNVATCSPAESLGLLQPGGRLIGVGKVDMTNSWGILLGAVRTKLRFLRSGRTYKMVLAAPNREDLTTLGELVADGRVVPEIQRTVDFDGVADAVRELCTGHVRSKIVVVPEAVGD